MTTLSTIVHLEDGQPVTTSLLIAERFRKEHKDVLRAIRNLDCSNYFRERNFALTVEIKHLGNIERETPYYKITRDGFSFLCMGFTGKEAALWKENYIDAFNLLEQQVIHQQSTLIELNSKLKDRLMVDHLRYRQMYRYLSKGLNQDEIARCMQISTRAVRMIKKEMRELELLPEQEIFVMAHTGKIARTVTATQLGLLEV